MSVGSRPGISYSVFELARNCHEPTESNTSLVKIVLQHVARTVTLGLKYLRPCPTLSRRSIAVSVDAYLFGYDYKLRWTTN